MNEKLQYAEMLNIPVSTSTITVKPKKKTLFKKKKDVDAVKQELIQKVNAESITDTAEVLTETETESIQEKKEIIYPNTVNIVKGKKKKGIGKLKVNVIGVELIVIGILSAIICLTTALVPQSGLNVFFKEVFGGGTNAVNTDGRVYNEFAPVLPISNANGIEITDGVMKITSEGAIYSPCDGKISNLAFDQETNKYTVEITHSDNFKSVISGIDYAYGKLGDSVFSNIPVGHIKDVATLCFMGADGNIISNFTLDGNNVVWAV